MRHAGRVREEERPGPQFELLAVGRFESDAADRAAAQTQIGQFAVVERVQLGNGVAVDAALGDLVGHNGAQVGYRLGKASGGAGVGSVSHVVSLFLLI